MMKEKVKGQIGSLFKYFGLEIKKIPTKYCFHINAYADQKALLSAKEVKIVFDIGASVGGTVGRYYDLFETSQIYCFEPVEDTFKVLCESYKDVGSIKPYRLAVTDKTGSKRLFLNKASYTNSLLQVAAESGKYVDNNLTQNLGYLDVETTALDEFCKKECISEIQILKMDIQGGELMALQGAVKLLTARRIDLIYTEVLFAKLYRKQANVYNLCEFLDQYGYVLYGLYNLSYGRNGVLAWGDAIFISPSLEESLKR